MTRTLGLLLTLGVSAIGAQGVDNGGESGRRALLPRAEEIALARSAAPAAVSDSATIFLLTDAGYELGVKGTNGAACYVSRDWLKSIEPHCFDSEGAATIMPMHMLRVSMLHRGSTKAAADRAVADSLAAGSFKLPRRPAMSYMMSAEQKLIAPNGQPAGAWRPHLMIYYPWLSANDLGGGAANPTASVVDEGKPTANIMIVVKDFVQVRRER
jgi:hypothetical protein